MAARIGLFLVTVLTGVPLSSEQLARWTVWNVGQGQWVTYRTHSQCYHFDTGGEFPPWQEIMEECRDKLNLFSYSHWDWDHVGFASRLPKILPRHCLLLRPEGAHSPRKERLFVRLDACSETKPFKFWNPKTGSSANELSRVFLWRNVLIPGDSPIEQEKVWTRELAGLESTRWLIIGHHGSRTSTGPELLTRLGRLRGAIASARRSRYGHPHPEIRSRLEERRIPLLTTEDWGHIHFYD
jgi:competence protein ComEC